MMYVVACFGFFFIGGLMALFIRTELAAPGLQFLSNEQYNQLFTMHGTIMLLFYATPIVFGFANLRAAAADRRPRCGVPAAERVVVLAVSVRRADRDWPGFSPPAGAADFGWTAYTPLSRADPLPGRGRRSVDHGSGGGGLGTILGAVNMITTVVCMRAPGMTMWRMPIFTWNILVTSILVLIAFPVLTAALFGLAADRHFGSHVFDPANGGTILWQHLFWFFGHPEVYIVALPFFGIVTEVIPVFSRKPVFGYTRHGLRHDVDRRVVDRGVGASHVRHRRGAAAVLFVHELLDRDADRDQVLQLDRHDVEGPDQLRDTDAVRRWASW